MPKLSENHRTEFKLKLTDQLEKQVVGFLNSREGGDIFIGVTDEGQVVGVDDIDSVPYSIFPPIFCGSYFHFQNQLLLELKLSMPIRCR